jgi:hypothetical protein
MTSSSVDDCQVPVRSGPASALNDVNIIAAALLTDRRGRR